MLSTILLSFEQRTNEIFYQDFVISNMKLMKLSNLFTSTRILKWNGVLQVTFLQLLIRRINILS